MNGWTMSNVREDLNAVIQELFDLKPEQMSDQTSFEELGLDSLDALRLVAGIERKFGVEIPEREIPEVHRLGDVHAMVGRYLANAG